MTGKLFICLLLVTILLVAGIGIGVLANYIWPRATVPFTVEEPIEILDYTTELNFYPGETKEFNVTVLNHATISYNVTLNFQLDVPNYQARYATFSDEVYLVTTGQHDLEAWASIRADAPTINCTLTVEIRRATETHGIAEDFTDGTWIEVDPNNHINVVGTSQLDFACRRDEDAYVYKDFGAGYFTEFEHRLTIKATNLDLWEWGGVWVLSNAVDDAYGLFNSHETYIRLCFYSNNDGRHIRLQEYCDPGTGYTGIEDYFACSLGTKYYLTIKKVGLSLTCEIYGDENRTDLLDILNLTLRTDSSFRYLFAALASNTMDGHTTAGRIYISDLIL